MTPEGKVRARFNAVLKLLRTAFRTSQVPGNNREVEPPTRASEYAPQGRLAVQLSTRTNAQAESFIKTLKYEEVYRTEYRNLEDARASIGEFLEKIYNRERLHSALGYRPPLEFERHLQRAHAMRRGRA